LSIGLLPAAGLIAQPQTVHSRAAEPREHHLFVGAELLLRQGDALVPVQRIKGDQALLEAPVKDYVSIRQSDGLIWRMATKVAAVSARIEDLKTDVSSSAELQAFADQARLQSDLAEQSAIIDRSAAMLSRELTNAQSLAESSDPLTAAAGEQELERIGIAQSELATQSQEISAITDATYLDEVGATKGGRENDILHLSFRVSSATELPNAYVFVAVRVWANDRYFDTNFHRHLSNIGPKPRRVDFTRQGYPKGFEIKDTKIYLFSHGEEIPTNLSEKHFPLSYEEAKEFLHLSHLGEHRRETVPARPAWSLVPPELLSVRSASSLDYPVTVKLDEKGAIIDSDTTRQIVPDHVQSMVNQLTFIPALENGTPVPSTLTINLADFLEGAPSY
jgi:hypothetical protein